MLDWDIVKSSNIETGKIAGDIIINSKGDIKTIGNYETDELEDTKLLAGNNILNGLIWNRTNIFTLFQENVILATNFINELFENNNKINSINASFEDGVFIITYNIGGESLTSEVITNAI